jgi:hypothetical protein
MSVEVFDALVSEIAASMSGFEVDSSLETFLNEIYGVGTPEFGNLRDLCGKGEREGWLLKQEAGGIKFGRVIKANTSAGPFSVDVVRMKDIEGPHHIHANGEIGAVLAIDGSPKFDGKAEGWYVYPPGSHHRPTVSGGDAYVLYYLPQGAIEFTGR